MSGFRPRREGSVLVLSLRRPPGNALSREALEGLRRELAAARAEESVRALVLASDLPRYFSSGLDLEEILAAPEGRRRESFELLLAAYRDLLLFPKPAVAALSGAAILGGWILAMGCDARVLAEDTGKVALSEVRLGLSPSPALIERLRALSSSESCLRALVLEGRTLRAAEARAAGLVDELTLEADVLSRALARAKGMGRGAPGAFAAVKAAVNAPFTEEALWRRSLAEFAALMDAPEAKEGLAAMKEKRRPRWET